MVPYYDRHGAAHYPDVVKNTVRPRTGAWIALREGCHMLMVIAGNARAVPELPGGGVEKSESLWQGALREFQEEADIVLAPDNCEVIAEHKQSVHFYADDVDEYWDYDQTYFLIQQTGASLYHESVDSVPEGLRFWRATEQMNDSATHYFHAMAIKAFIK
jgi:8-oxo-dGTP pyrophosphatase MutT (NUDIX family)|tara:strand:+ start:132062 stop:132541 length:480 start_codon:yes stop_codon:yes gene_type:complete